MAILGLNMDKGFVPIFFNFFMRFKFLQYRIIIDNLYFLKNVNVYRAHCYFVGLNPRKKGTF